MKGKMARNVLTLRSGAVVRFMEEGALATCSGLQKYDWPLRYPKKILNNNNSIN